LQSATGQPDRVMAWNKDTEHEYAEQAERIKKVIAAAPTYRTELLRP